MDLAKTALAQRSRRTLLPPSSTHLAGALWVQAKVDEHMRGGSDEKGVRRGLHGCSRIMHRLQPCAAVLPRYQNTGGSIDADGHSSHVMETPSIGGPDGPCWPECTITSKNRIVLLGTHLITSGLQPQ